jgi:hypothetical protein
MYRVNPQIIYNIGKMNIGLECQWTAVQYGDYRNETRLDANGVPVLDDKGKEIVDKYLNGRALATDNLHWVGNHRINLMVKYNF